MGVWSSGEKIKQIGAGQYISNFNDLRRPQLKKKISTVRCIVVNLVRMKSTLKFEDFLE